MQAANASVRQCKDYHPAFPCETVRWLRDPRSNGLPITTTLTLRKSSHTTPGLTNCSKLCLIRPFLPVTQWQSRPAQRSSVRSRPGTGLKVRSYRYEPDIDDAPDLKDYGFEASNERSLMVLALIEQLEERDPALTFRRGCHEDICGSDGISIKGANVLACIAGVSTVIQGGVLPSGPKLARSNTVTIRPLPRLHQLEPGRR
jgi:hypothetical protein